MLSRVLGTSSEWGNWVNLRVVDALRVPDDSPGHPGGHTLRKINLTWEIPA